MKSKFTILLVAALFTGACTSGTYVTSSYTDDIYFNPADVPPPIVAEGVPRQMEEPVEKPKAVKKPRAPKQEMHVQQPNNQVPPFPPRLSRTAAREALYHSLASGGLS